MSLSYQRLKMDISYLLSFIGRKHLHEVYSNQLEKLVMSMYSKVMDYHGVTFSNCRFFPGLRCLRQLGLIIRTTPGESLIFYVLLIGKCSFLSTLFVQFYDEVMSDPEKKFARALFGGEQNDLQWRVNRYCHKRIKVVRLMDFVDDKSYIEFAMHLARMCKSLEKLIVKPKSDTHRVAIIESGAKQLL